MGDKALKATTGSIPAAEWVAIDTLAPWDKNPRRNDEAAKEVAKSIQRFGFGAPILARAADRVVIAGHTRLKAAALLGLDKVPVRFLDLDPAEARALALADNKLGELAEWDAEILGDVLRELEADGAVLDGLGFSEEELRALMADPEVEPSEGDDDAPAVDEQGEPDSVQGGVYELGPHRLVCGDCRDPEVVAGLLGGRAINLAFTSPPYASQRTYDETSGFKPIPPDEYVDWFDAVQANVSAHLAPDGSWFVNIKEHCDDGQRSLYVKDLTIAHVRQWGWWFVDEFAWVRGGVPGGWNNRFKNGWEPVFHFARAGAIRFRPDAVSVPTDRAFDYSPENTKTGTGSGFVNRARRGEGTARPSNVVQVATGATLSGEHSAEFPVALPSFFVLAYTDHGDTIFDPFLGSGTTLIASAQNSRIAYGTEISPRYCDVIRRRWTRWAREHGRDPGPGALDG